MHMHVNRRRSIQNLAKQSTYWNIGLLREEGIYITFDLGI